MTETFPDLQYVSEILTFPGFFLFFHDIFFKILKFHEISMNGKAPIIFQGFPSAVGTLPSFAINKGINYIETLQQT